MEKLVLRSLKIALIFPLILTACSGSKLEEVFGIDSNTHVTGSFSQYDNAKISGTGRVRFNATLPTSSNRSFNLKASLDQAIGNSSVAVIFYSPDLTVPNNKGVVVTFKRNGINVEVTVSTNKSTNSVEGVALTSKLTAYQPALLDVIIEVHNTSQPRVLIWRKDVLGYTAANADIDTNRAGDLTPSLPASSGGGGFVGLDLINATVSAATVSSQKLPN